MDELHLRPLTDADVDEWIAGQDEEQIRWFEFPRRARLGDVADAIARWQESWESLGPVRHWAICVPPTEAIAGGVEVRDLGDGEVNLSYVVFPSYRRRGLATKASRMALDYARRELAARIGVIKILEGNEASVGVAYRLGGVETEPQSSPTGRTFRVFRVDLRD